jgi:hypothetical protein
LYIATASIKLPLAVASKHNSCSELRVTLPTFAILVLRQRAKDQHLNVSAIVEALILEGVMLDEVERMMKQSPEFARVAVEWMREAVTRKN